MNSPTRHPGRPQAFTTVELLAVIGIIALLMAILIPTLAGAFGTAERAKTETHLNTMKQGIEAFTSDFQYEPPLVAPPIGSTNPDQAEGIRTPDLDPSRFAEFYNDSASNPLEAYRAARYYSEYSLPVYLLGLGDLNGDGKTVYAERNAVPPKTNLDDGKDGPGMRNPGEFRAWKKRNTQQPVPPFVQKPAGVGREYGPYVDPGFIKDIIKEVRIGANGRPDPSGNIVMYTMNDKWGTPYRYYRNWPTRKAAQSATDREKASVARIPIELRNPDSVKLQIESNIADNTDGRLVDLDRDALNARYMLVAAGEKPDLTDSNGVKITPFGDVALNDSSTLVTVLPLNADFSPATLDGYTKELVRTFTKSNVRVVP